MTSLFHCTSYIVNRITKEQGKGIIKKNDRIQRQGKIEIAHTKTTKRRGTRKKTEHRGETNTPKWDDIKTEALTDYPCSRGVVRGELNWLRIVAHAKDDFRGNILVIFYYIIRLKFNIIRKLWYIENTTLSRKINVNHTHTKP